MHTRLQNVEKKKTFAFKCNLEIFIFWKRSGLYKMASKKKSNLNQMKNVKIPKNPKLPDARGEMKAFFDKKKILLDVTLTTFSIA